MSERLRAIYSALDRRSVGMTFDKTHRDPKSAFLRLFSLVANLSILLTGPNNLEYSGYF
jgi:hypothetical protein